MAYTVSDSEIVAVTRKGADGKSYTLRQFGMPGPYESELVLVAAFDAACGYADMSVSDSEDGFTFADFFRRPFNLDTLAEEIPKLHPDEIAYAETFAGAMIYRETSGGIYLRFFDSEEEFDNKYRELAAEAI